MKIEGIPDGYRLVRLGSPHPGEFYLDVFFNVKYAEITVGGCFAVLQKIWPVCTWQHGVFADGWITEDKDRTMTWCSKRPLIKDHDDSWNNQPDSTWIFIREAGQKTPQFVNPPKFRDDLDWTERIVEVGPSVEK